MKTKLLLVLAIFSFSTTFFAQSIEFTSTLSAAEIGTTVTINYKYTVASDGNIYSAINLYNGSGEWQSKVVDGSLSPAPAGTEVTGSFNFTIPEGTTPTADLTGDLNYKLVIELSDAGWNWLAGDYPATEINLTNETLSTNDIKLQDKVKLFYANQKINVSGLDVSDEYELSLFDLTGREVLSFSKQDNKIISLPTSLYIARLKVNNQQSIARKIFIP